MKLNLFFSTLLLATSLIGVANPSNASTDTPAQKICLQKAAAARAAAIAAGTPRVVADKAWVKAVAACKRK